MPYPIAAVRNKMFGNPFLPTDIPGLQLWLRADAGLWQDSVGGTPAVADSDVVGAWADQSGNGNHATQATTSKKPLLKLNIVNGKPVVRFDGVDDLLTIADNAGLDLTGLTAFMVGTVIGSGYNNPIFFMKNASLVSDAGVYGFGQLRSTKKALVVLNGAAYSSDSAMVDGTFYILDADYDGSNYDHYRNGGADGNGAGPGAVSASTGTLQVGGYDASWSGRENTNGDIAEILIYNSALSTAARQQVEAYLNARYAIY